ncbi:unnamed protein product [Scytosiphon promiscuus]
MSGGHRPLRTSDVWRSGSCALAMQLFCMCLLTHDTAALRPYERELGNASEPSRDHNRALQPLPTDLFHQHVDMGWTEESRIDDGRSTVSVIVVEWRPHESNLFRDKERVRAFSNADDGGAVVQSVQFATPFPQAAWEASGHPFDVAHAEGVDKRVRIVFITDFMGRLDERQASHLKAACEDESETTVLMVVDETCQYRAQPRKVPVECSNFVRIYPSNIIRPGQEEHRRTAYRPLGPRDTFPFIAQERRRPTSARPMLFNLQVRARTSQRRKDLIEIVKNYQHMHSEIRCLPQGKPVSAEEWQDILLDSKFTLAPAGHNAETFRTWEALESGSIPIVSKTDFTEPEYEYPRGVNCRPGTVGWNTVAASPFAKQVSVNTWSELPELLDRLRHEPVEYIDKLQADCAAWYSSVMKQTYRSMLNFGEGHDLFPQDGPLFT